MHSEYRLQVIDRFGPSAYSIGLICPLLTSAYPSHHLSMIVAPWQVDRSPRVMHTHLHAYARRIYVHAFRTGIGLWISLPPHPTCTPLCDSCSSGQRFACGFLQIPPHDGHPCRPASSSPCRACRELTPPSRCALPGAQNEKGP